MQLLSDDSLPFSAYCGDDEYLFASYSHADAAVVYEELARLDAGGFNIWYDEGIAPAMRWTQQLAGAIEASSVFVAFITPRFVASDNCIDELQFAITHRKPVLAIHLVPTELSAGLELMLGSKQALLKYKYTPDVYAHKVRQALESLLPGRLEGARTVTGSGEHGAGRTTGSFVRPLSRTRARWRSGLAVAGALAILAAAGSWFWTGTTRSVDSIAILPFLNGNGDPDTDYLAEGISESITNDLSGIQSLRVMAQDSVRRYRGRQVEARTVGDELGVRMVLTGMITSRGEQLRIQAELIEARTGAQLWGQQETRNREELLDMQNDIATRISRSLKVELSDTEKTRLAERYTPNAGAYESYLKGRYYWNQRTNEGYWRAIELFRRAIDLDPNYARAYVGLADSEAFLEIEGVPPRNQYQTALEILDKALQIDDTIGEAHASMGMLMQNKDWNFAAAENEYRRAIDLTPSYASAYHWYGELLVQMGRFDEAFELYSQASELDPLSSAIHSDVGLAWYFARDYERAITELRKSIESDPSFSRTHHYLAKVYAQVGQYAEAVDAQQKGWLLAGDNPDDVARRIAGLRRALERSGARSFWEAQLEVAQTLRGSDATVDVAELYARLGNRDRSFALLERAFDSRLFALLFLKVDPAWDELRDDPRFRDLLVRIGFPSAAADSRPLEEAHAAPTPGLTRRMVLALPSL